MWYSIFEGQDEVETSLEENTEVIAKTTVLLRTLIAQSLGCRVEDIPVGTTIYCARECCSDIGRGDYRQKPFPEIERNAQLVADTTAMAIKSLANALCLKPTEIPIGQAINCALESIWNYEQKQSDKAWAKGGKSRESLMKSLKEDF